MNTKIASCLLIVAVFLAGFFSASTLCEKKYAEEKADFLEKQSKLEAKYRDVERKRSQALADALTERDQARDRLSRVERSTERVRIELREAKRRLSAADSSPCKREREQLARGAELVGEGSDLLGQCFRLAEKSALDKETLVRLTNTR